MDEHGQATLEYVALVAVVAVLLTAALVAFDPGGIVNAVAGQFRRALCLVGGGECTAHRPRPCVVHADGARRKLSLSLGVVRLDDEHFLLRERLSDRTVRLTVMREGALGGELAMGVKGGLATRRFDLVVGGQVAATLQGVLGDGRVFVVGSEAAADRLQERLRRDLPLILDTPLDAAASLLGIDRDDGPEPDLRYEHVGAKGAFEVDLHAAGRGRAELEGVASNVIGVRRERATGRRTYYIRVERQGNLLLGAALDGSIGALDATAQGQAIGTLSLTVDRRGRPLTLGLLATGRAGARGRLPSGSPATAAASVGGREARQWEVHAEADLTDPRVRAAWAGWRRSPLSGNALSALGAALNAAGRLDLREYRFRSRTGTAGFKISRGLSLGGEVEKAWEQLRLVSADTRPPGGVWERRVDCLEAS